ncbi:MAG: ParB/RepB/Spo0J family partition protein [Planctomycetaceae bacterium]|jgi:ParB-like chromosome segregation protein Spo0J|nr:ParB/RepB/Spo0J family partition protein [Planctomycetaceae bacterium]
MTIDDVKSVIEKFVEGLDTVERNLKLNDVRKVVHEVSGIPHPVGCVQYVPVDRVQANDYNPNAVAPIEMGLLYTSIKADGYTQPTVSVYDDKTNKFVIIDGFHRYFTMKTREDIKDISAGLLPVVVLDKNINERMAATVRHNRARGTHSVKGMSNMVFEMLKNGKSDADICNELGMQPEELIKLKHITGYSKLYKDAEYGRAWAVPKGTSRAKVKKDK